MALCTLCEIKTPFWLPFMIESSSSKPLSVSGLTRKLKHYVEQNFFGLWVCGEVTGLTSAASGHYYFSLKDSGCQVNCVIWRSNAIGLNLDFLKDGVEVICRGNLDIYGPRGIYQLNIRKIQPVGQGALQQAFQKLFEKLKSEGLFDPTHKQPLPKFPRRVAVVTSPDGAAIRDFLQVIKRRWADIEVIIVPVQVQGPGSAERITDALYAIPDFRENPDVVVVTRGGGSLKDLWSFNDERVCRAIFNCPIPVISGVGHEVDVTLSDLVADVRALTPSEAAERLVPDRREVLESLFSAKRRLALALNGRLQSARQQVENLAFRPVLTQPLERIRNYERQLDEIASRIQRNAVHKIESSQRELAGLVGQLDSLNPLSVLARGYSVTTDLNDDLIANSNEVKIGDTIRTRLNEGNVFSRVEKID